MAVVLAIVLLGARPSWSTLAGIAVTAVVIATLLLPGSIALIGADFRKAGRLWWVPTPVAQRATQRWPASERHFARPRTTWSDPEP